MVKDLIEKSFYANKEMFDDYENCAESRWLKKEVKEELLLFDGSSLENVELRNANSLHQAKMGLSKKYKIHTFSLLATANTKIENIKPRPSFSLKINFGKLNLSIYNRIRAKIYIEASGHQAFYFHFGFGNPDAYTNHAPIIVPNEVNDVVFEVEKIKRDAVEYITITPFLMGCPPEADPVINVYVLELKAELVDPEYELGWNLDNKIAYSHSGYFPKARKVAIIENTSPQEFAIYNEEEKLVFQGVSQEVRSRLGTFQVLDFSKLEDPGVYTIKTNNFVSNKFVIAENPYLASIWKSLNFLRMLRCGEDVAGVHSACHLNCRTYDEDGRTVPNFGGWHDAGDVSQFEICTAEIAHALLDLAKQFKETDKILYERILDEAKVGVSWLLRTRFGNGYRALAVTYRIWRDNVLDKDNDTVFTNPAENGPFENFCAAACEAEAYLAYKDLDPAYANWCLRAAKEDFEFAKEGYKQGIYTKRWGPSIPAQTSGEGAIAASILYKITNDEYYLEEASKYLDDVMACQEVEYHDWDIKVRGFFYEDPLHKYILSYDHRGHDQTPIHALVAVSEVAPHHPNYQKWQTAINLYKEYIEKTIEYTQPYGLLPANIYILDKINLDHITIPASIPRDKAKKDLESQIKAGIKLGNNAYLRIFPIAIQRRGFHATLLSKTKAVSMIAKILNDEKLKQIAIDQLEWVMGKNPFSSSTMYGEGYNYHPLYVAFSRQIVGALPVGIKTYKELDEPYWPVINNAVYKEIWGHTTGKYLWVLADIK